MAAALTRTLVRRSAALTHHRGAGVPFTGGISCSGTQQQLLRCFASSPDPATLTAFESACATAGPRIATSGTNSEKLKAYALYKQAREGDAPSGARPGVLDFVGRAKYDAWAALAGTSKSDAMRQYVTAFAGDAASVPKGGGSRADDGDVPATPVNKHNPVGAFLPIEGGPMLPAGTFKGKVRWWERGLSTVYQWCLLDGGGSRKELLNGEGSRMERSLVSVWR